MKKLRKRKRSRKISEKKLDDAFSLHIRTRDNFTCLRCGLHIDPPTNLIHCSHFYTRNARSVRFDDDNGDAMCYGCHRFLETRKNGEYTDIKKKQLGQSRFNALRRRYYTLRVRPPTELEKQALLEAWK